MEHPAFLSCLLALVVFLTQCLHVRSNRDRCEPIRVNLCLNIEYNQTVYPNIMHHADQREAGIALHQFHTLVEFNCSPNLRLFLCSVFVPMCSDYNQAFPPCRHMCQEARSGCELLMNHFGYTWPSALECNKFPIRKPGELCFGPDEIPEANDNFDIGLSRCKYGVGFNCPAHMAVPKKEELGYHFMDADDCGAPCDEDRLLFWDKNQRKFAVLWIGCWSFLCLISTLFTVLTYFIDMRRFRYPERPILFLSGCYFMVAVAYVCGFFLRDSVACQQFYSKHCHTDTPISDCPKVVTQGTKQAGCTILFMVIYFFSMASSIWWVMLTVTWFLAAGLKWGNEAIEAKSPYFHGVAWSLPALQTIAVLVSSRIEGDVLSGVCYVGVYNTTHLLWALLVPLSLYLLTGTGFLIAGFVSMVNIRNVVKHNGEVNRVEKLERLMVRIGVFSVLYTVPATVTIACYFYEQLNRDSWQQTWLARTCNSNSVPCPCQQSENKEHKPHFIVFIIKYFMMLIVGITSGFWIWSSKTVEAWTYFKDRVCCEYKGRYQRGTIQNQQQTSSLPDSKDQLQRPFYP